VQINGVPVDYNMDSRFYYLMGDGTRRAFRVTRETVWHVRTQTTAKSAKADETILWRPKISTQCSGGRVLDGFDENTRFISLQRYRAHHARMSDSQVVDSEIGAKFHFPIQNPESGRCDTYSRTDNPRTVGDLHQIYGFDDQPDPVLLARWTTVNRAVARESKIYSGFTSELAHAAPGEVACFGFTVPLPTRSTYWTQINPWARNGEARTQALTWKPDRTIVSIQGIPKGERPGPQIVRWKQVALETAGTR
jgi:hypothetical protein